MKVAVIGATGMVGGVIIQVLEERKFPITQLIPVASERSMGRKVSFQSNKFPILSIKGSNSFEKISILYFLYN